jgi:predicted transcriptional regulator
MGKKKTNERLELIMSELSKLNRQIKNVTKQQSALAHRLDKIETLLKSARRANRPKKRSAPKTKPIDETALPKPVLVQASETTRLATTRRLSKPGA